MNRFVGDDYANYQGVTYRVSKIDNDSIRLVSEDEKSINFGFSLRIPDKKYSEDPKYRGIKFPDVYIKIVSRKDLNDLYRIHYYAEYEGLSFQIVTTNILRKTITIGTNDAEIARKYDFIRPDKYYFEKELPLSEVQVVEEKVDLLNDKGVVDFKYVND